MTKELSKEEWKILDTEHNQEHYAKIEILDGDEIFVSAIEGRVMNGSLQINASSNMRQSASFTFVAEEDENDLSNVDNLLAINRRVRILEGIVNDGLLEDRPDIIWVQLGIFVISQISFNRSTSGLKISVSVQDKMCLLNGTQGGNLPTSIVFDSYDQIIGYSEVKGSKLPEDPNTYTVYYFNGKYYRWNGSNWEDSSYAAVGKTESVPQRIYDIIQTLVCRYGNIPISKIFINDVNLEIHQIVRFTGTGTLYHNSNDKRYTMNTSSLKEAVDQSIWIPYSYNEDCGYQYTDFTYPGELVSAIGDNVCSVLDKIVEVLGNFEYFFDREGNFIFQEIKNYLNNSYDPVDIVSNNEAAILNNDNYILDVKSNSKSVYTFAEGNGLVSSYANTPNYANIKNDFHIWGKNGDDIVIHYHVAIKRKPTVFNTYAVVFLTDDNGNYTGKLRLATDKEKGAAGITITNGTIYGKDDSMMVSGETLTIKDSTYDAATETVLITETEIAAYQPQDWRAELYLQGLVKESQQIRPDIYEQELLDLFDDIYDFKNKTFKVDIVKHPNDLTYFFDYIEPADDMYDYSVDLIGPRIYSYQQEKVRRLYNTDIPNVIIVNMEDDNADKIIQKCALVGQTFSRVSESVAKNISLGTWGYTAQEIMRNLVYQYTSMKESVSLNAIPIYHLDVNNRITIQDRYSKIFGDYVVQSISLPLGGNGTMSITASRALERF